MRRIEFDGGITTAGQPETGELTQLGSAGWKAVVNFRIDDEESGMTSPEIEREIARGQAVEYRRYPIAMKAMNSAVVDRFIAEFPQLPRPLLAHCQSGKRAAAMVLMAQAIARHDSGDEAIRTGERLGIEWDHGPLEEFVRHYVDRHRSTTGTA